MHIFLETERLILRRFTTDDVDNLVELDSDPDVMFYVTGGRATAREEVEKEILPAFGYRLRKSAWGKGYAAEGSIAGACARQASHSFVRATNAAMRCHMAGGLEYIGKCALCGISASSTPLSGLPSSARSGGTVRSPARGGPCH
jgi:hypothetical protein